MRQILIVKPGPAKPRPEIDRSHAGSYRFTRCGEGYALASMSQDTGPVPSGTGLIWTVDGHRSNLTG